MGKVTKKFCISIDIVQKIFDAIAIFVESTVSLNEVGFKQFDNCPSGFRALVSWTKKLCKQCNDKLSEDGLFCMETTGGYDRQICMCLHDKGQNVWYESALQIHRSSGSRRGKNGGCVQHFDFQWIINVISALGHRGGVYPHPRSCGAFTNISFVAVGRDTPPALWWMCATH